MTKKLFVPAWILISISLLLYSITQIDLSLTLSRISVWQGIQKSFQYIGYFNRPLSTAIFISIVILMYGLYLFSLRIISQGIISKKVFWGLLTAICVILFFSYNAFSYDLFNYIFDAKIVTHYHQNPYLHKALDYPGDPMLSFMHWTERTFPYGPVWLSLTVPISFIGFGYFLLTWYFFKLLMLGSFIGSAKLIEKIAEKCKFKNPLFIVAAFALNPLVIIESLVSSHNDIVMVFLMLLSVYYLFGARFLSSSVSFLLAFLLKFANAFLLPAYLFILKKKDSFESFFYIAVICMIVPVILATLRTNYQPWYLLFILPFASFVARKYFILIPIVVISVGSLFNYVPFLYLGNWNPPVPEILLSLNIGSVILSIVIIGSVRQFVRR